MPDADTTSRLDAQTRDNQEIGALLQVVAPAGLVGGAVYGLSMALMLGLSGAALSVMYVVFGLIVLNLLTWAFSAAVFAAPVVHALLPRGVMTAERLAWLPERTVCGMIGAVLGLAGAGVLALCHVVLSAAGLEEPLDPLRFVALSAGLIAAGISLGLRFHRHRAGAGPLAAAS